MGSVSLLMRFRNSLNEYLVTVTGRSIEDIQNNNYFEDKFDISMFVTLMVFLSTFIVFCCIGTTYECCFSNRKKKRHDKQRMRSAIDHSTNTTETKKL